MFLKNLEIIAPRIMDYVQVIFLSAPTLSWEAMLNMTKVELELIPDRDMYIFFEKGTGGIISYIFNRCSKANKNQNILYT